MAKIIGGVTTSHIPAVGNAIANGLTQEPYWKRFFDGYKPAQEWLQKHKPDIAIVVYNDHGLNFFLDKMPTFAVGAAPEYRNADEGWGIPQVPAFEGQQDLSWHLIEQLVEAEFDPVTCQEMLVDHAFTLPMALLWPDQRWPVKVVPVCINTVQAPLPSARRCRTSTLRLVAPGGQASPRPGRALPVLNAHGAASPATPARAPLSKLT